MITTEIHTAISLTPAFANMSHFLVRSIARNAQLPDPWNIVFTVSRDTAGSPDTPEWAWARDFPVEFRWVDADLWNRLHFTGTGQQRVTYDYGADVVLFIDADVLVSGSLRDLVTDLAGSDRLAAWPAWMPPPNVDLDALIRECGLAPSPDTIRYSGHAIDFMEPEFCPPYFNFGFIAMSRSAASRIATTFADDVAFVCARHDTYFACQIALCLSILRNRTPIQLLDERFNYGNAEWGEMKYSGPATDAAVARSKSCARDVRILHYLTKTEPFQKFREMASLEALREFCAKDNVGEGNSMLQREFRRLLDR
jgi:hypothetical protein